MDYEKGLRDSAKQTEKAIAKATAQHHKLIREANRKGGLSVRRIADLLDISHGTVGNIVKRK